jgi:dienelactone hydrolase
VAKLRTSAILAAALLLAGATPASAAGPQPSGTVVEFETPLESAVQLQGLLRQPAGMAPSPAVVLLHSCNGDFRRLDERWGVRIAAWGYVTLSVDSFGPRGLKNTCNGSIALVDLAHDAYRALNFLVKQPLVDPARIAVLGFSQGGSIALTSVEHGIIEQTAPHKFRSAIAFYPPCLTFTGNMTVPTLIMVGELDDWTPAQACRNMVEGREDFGVSRQKSDGAPVRLIVYPDAYHGFDAPGLAAPKEMLGHHLEFNKAAAEQSARALHDFLDATIGEKEAGK